MSSVFKYLSSSGYVLKESDVMREDAICGACKKPATGSSVYACVKDDSGETYYLHNTCSEFFMSVNYHPHPLRLNEDVIIGEDATCHVCNTPVTGSPTYTCIHHDVDINCRNFYLHKSCAELPKQINHHKHNMHYLSLLPRPDHHSCDICRRHVKVYYACVNCDFYVCVFCAFEQRVLHHDGHKEHTLTLMKKEALFECDACYEEAKDSSYVCTACEFWIHKSCAFSPSIIPNPTYHHHPLTLVYSIPDIHRNFRRFCGVCNEQVHKSYWLYYCHKCTYFVHMKCSTSTVSMVNEIEADDIDNEPNLVQFPLPSQESIFNLIVTQYRQFRVDFKGEGENSITISTTPNVPHIIEKHWSHKIHPLQQLHFTISENDNNNDDDRRVLICDGCIQPITASHPSYYACIQCGFYLHSFCATKLPYKLPVGASSFHPNHSLLLRGMNKFRLLRCGVCCLLTNGFYYYCHTCNIKIDIRCALLPTRIKHKSHKHHSLVQRPSSASVCSVSRLQIENGVEYACGTCSNFQIHILCLFFPSRMEHKYDIHPITLKNPPFFYEGVFYCEICEEQVDNSKYLYHCSESDHSFHYDCFSISRNVNLGGTIEVNIFDEPHKLALVYKKITRKNPRYYCSSCKGYLDSSYYFFECDGCGYLACYRCVITSGGNLNAKPITQTNSNQILSFSST